MASAFRFGSKIPQRPPTPPEAQSPAIGLLPEGVAGFIVRPNNVMVPCVPVDQLPFRIAGIPSSLEFPQNQSLRFIGHKGPATGKFQLEAQTNHSPPPPVFVAPDAKVRGLNPKPQLSLSSRTGIDSGDDLASDIASTYRTGAYSQRYNFLNRPIPPSGIEPDSTKKEYCTYWIKTGECAYTVPGCRYKHEMPPIEKLREIGFTQIPRWWKDKTALRPQETWLQRKLKEGEEESVPERSPIRGIFREMFKRPELKATEEQEESSTCAVRKDGFDLLIDVDLANTLGPCLSAAASSSYSKPTSQMESKSHTQTMASLQSGLSRKQSSAALTPLSTPKPTQNVSALLRRYSASTSTSDSDTDDENQIRKRNGSPHNYDTHLHIYATTTNEKRLQDSKHAVPFDGPTVKDEKPLIKEQKAAGNSATATAPLSRKASTPARSRKHSKGKNVQRDIENMQFAHKNGCQTHTEIEKNARQCDRAVRKPRTRPDVCAEKTQQRVTPNPPISFLL